MYRHRPFAESGSFPPQLVRKLVTVAGFIPDLVADVFALFHPVVHRFLTTVGHLIASFGNPASAFARGSGRRSARLLLPAINDGAFATDITIARQIQETAELRIRRASAARSWLLGSRLRRDARTFEC